MEKLPIRNRSEQILTNKKGAVIGGSINERDIEFDIYLKELQNEKKTQSRTKQDNWNIQKGKNGEVLGGINNDVAGKERDFYYKELETKTANPDIKRLRLKQKHNQKTSALETSHNSTNQSEEVKAAKLETRNEKQIEKADKLIQNSKKIEVKTAKESGLNKTGFWESIKNSAKDFFSEVFVKTIDTGIKGISFLKKHKMKVIMGLLVLKAIPMFNETVNAIGLDSFDIGGLDTYTNLGFSENDVVNIENTPLNIDLEQATEILQQVENTSNIEQVYTPQNDPEQFIKWAEKSGIELTKDDMINSKGFMLEDNEYISQTAETGRMKWGGTVACGITSLIERLADVGAVNIDNMSNDEVLNSMFSDQGFLEGGKAGSETFIGGNVKFGGIAQDVMDSNNNYVWSKGDQLMDRIGVQYSSPETIGDITDALKEGHGGIVSYDGHVVEWNGMIQNDGKWYMIIDNSQGDNYTLNGHLDFDGNEMTKLNDGTQVHTGERVFVEVRSLDGSAIDNNTELKDIEIFSKKADGKDVFQPMNQARAITGMNDKT